MSKYLYNTDGVFLPLTNRVFDMHKVFDIMEQGFQEGWVYKPARFADTI